MNGTPGGKPNYSGMGVPPRGMMPIQQHFTGPLSSFLNVFNQPGNYSVSLNFNPRNATAAPNPQAAGQTMKQLVPQPGSPGGMETKPVGSTSPFGDVGETAIFRVPNSPMKGSPRVSQSGYNSP